MKKILAALATVCLLALAPVASADEPDTGSAGEDSEGTVASCSGSKIKYTDAYYTIYQRTFRVAARVAYQQCPGYLRVTHVGGWYSNVSGPSNACNPAGAPSIDRFEVNLSEFDGYNASAITTNCDGYENWTWRDIPNRAVYLGDDKCFSATAKIFVDWGDDKSFSMPTVCLP